MKQITIMDRVSQREKINGRLVSFRESREKFLDIMPEFDSESVRCMFDNSTVKHIFICVYENTDGHIKRRIAGLSSESDKCQLKLDANYMAATIGIDIERSFEVMM